MKAASARRGKPATLRDHLDAIIAGTASAVANCPSEECFEISEAIEKCAETTIQDYAWGRTNLDALPCPSQLLPPLP